ncbi:KGGVGR-motif variant AAA ATPase [Bdellovibrio sp. BCCA]|uniref:KGGVGR-motif variant AAA ATPase n=1 Tax=Bdellovibrio sp. BCCA TaxID=3136281 RepID=UPI0030F0650A
MKVFKPYFTTFYSYKGGVGRTSALINSALHRAIEGDRVVVIDFDLEAPGIWPYVKEIAKHYSVDVELENRDGILEYLYEAVNSNEIPNLKSRAVSGKDLGLKNIEGQIWFIGAGNTSKADYSRKLSALNWASIFENNAGAAILANFKKQLAHEFDQPDHIFIDSRTGITEVGGVCTKYLADQVVTLSSLNDQNIRGTAKVVNSFRQSNISTILVASNVPAGLPWGKDQMFTERINLYKEAFGSFPSLLVYHYPSLSLSECIPVLFYAEKEHSILPADPLLKSYANLSDEIDQRNPNSFKILVHDISYSLFASAPNKEVLDAYFAFWEKYYSNRNSLLNFLKDLYSVILVLQENDIGKELLKKDRLKELKAINNYAPTNYPSLETLKDFITMKAGVEIVKEIEKDCSYCKSAGEWFQLLHEMPRIRATEILIREGYYDFILKNVKSSEDDESTVNIFGRAFCFEKTGQEEKALELYEQYIQALGERFDEFESSLPFITMAFAAEKINNLELAQEAIQKTHKFLKTSSESEYFIPATWKKTNNIKEFKKYVAELENSINKKMQI